MTMRIVFMGTPSFSVPTLRALHAAGHDVVAAYTRPPAASARRGKSLVKSAVHQVAEELGIPVYTPANFKSEETAQAFLDHRADVAVVVAYGILLPSRILDGPRYGCFNGHASKLPRWRGAAPIERAIMAGDTSTAMSIMKMDAGLDTGEVALEQEVAINGSMVIGELYDALSLSCADLMVQAMASIESDTVNLAPQSDNGVQYAAKISKNELKIDFSQSAETVHNQVRALSPSAWFELTTARGPERIKVVKSEIVDVEGKPGDVIDTGKRLVVRCGDRGLSLVELQKAGGNPMLADAFLRGVAILDGTNILL